MPTTRPPHIRLNRHMYRGYETPDTPAEDGTHPSEQWRKFVDQGKTTCVVRGFMTKRLLCDQQDMTR